MLTTELFCIVFLIVAIVGVLLGPKYFLMVFFFLCENRLLLLFIS